jgi:hypothetical protein
MVMDAITLLYHDTDNGCAFEPSDCLLYLSAEAQVVYDVVETWVRKTTCDPRVDLGPVLSGAFNAC